MNFVYKKNLGQNFLKDKNIVKKIVDSADIDDKTLVIEIGPGAGAMSEMIISKAKYTIMYEIDERLKDILNNKLTIYSNYKIIFKDFLKEDVKHELSEHIYNNLYVVANLPYYITTAIVEKFINDDILPDKLILMMQKEVALRFSAKKNTRDYGSLTVLLNYYYDITKLFNVSRKSFIPEPNVDSTVVCMTKKKDRLQVENMDFFKKIVRDSFKHKRKNIKNNLSNYDLDKIAKILSKYNLGLDSRAESLDLEIFVDIANELI